jgi:hypothetical protein
MNLEFSLDRPYYITKVFHSSSFGIDKINSFNLAYLVVLRSNATS